MERLLLIAVTFHAIQSEDARVKRHSADAHRSSPGALCQPCQEHILEIQMPESACQYTSVSNPSPNPYMYLLGCLIMYCGTVAHW